MSLYICDIGIKKNSKYLNFCLKHQARTQGGFRGFVRTPPTSKKVQQFLIQKKIGLYFLHQLMLLKKIKGVSFRISSAVLTAGPPLCLQVDPHCTYMYRWTSAVPIAGPVLDLQLDLHLQVDLDPLYLQLDLRCVYSWTSARLTAGPPPTSGLPLYLQLNLL